MILHITFLESSEIQKDRNLKEIPRKRRLSTPVAGKYCRHVRAASAPQLNQPRHKCSLI